MMRTQTLLLHLAFLLFAAVSLTHRAMATSPPRLGGYQPIRNVRDPYVVKIGKFAVAEHNKQAGQPLVFVRVVSGQHQVVAGTNYKLVVEAKDAGAKKAYEAVVYDRPWEKVRTLTSFKPLP